MKPVMLGYVAVHVFKAGKDNAGASPQGHMQCMCRLGQSLILKPVSPLNFTSCHCSGRQSEDQERNADGRPVFLPFLDLPHGAQALCP